MLKLSSLMPLIESERAQDHAGIRAVHLAAFPTSLEADLVERLRTGRHALISLVARERDLIVGHVLFSPVTVHVDGRPEHAIACGLGLAPLAVLPAFQRRGIGRSLVEAGLAQSRQSRVGFVVVVGDPRYYSRFGFEPGSQFGLLDEYSAGDAFQVLRLDSAMLPAQGGQVRYGKEFAELA
jgi:putative acetyltransferase